MLRRVIIRLRVRLQGPRLVADLAGGVDPTATAEHWLCAARLVSRRRRKALASGVERILATAQDPRPTLTCAIPPRRQAVKEAQDDLAMIAGALRAPDPVRPQGVARVEPMLTDPASPVYGRGDLRFEAACTAALLPATTIAIVEPSLPRAA